MAKVTFYFSHDYNTRTDEKIKTLIRKHGMAGYGIFWSIIEDLYNNANALRIDYDGIAYDLRADCDMVKSIINDFDLFEFNGEYFRSESVEERLNSRNVKSEKARENANSRWAKMQTHSNGIKKASKRNAIKESKVKESKVKEIKESKINKEEEGLTPTPPPISKYSVQQEESFKKFKDWISTNATNVSKLKEPFTIDQYLSLAKKGYNVDKIRSLLIAMHNWKPLLSKNVSAYLTLIKWDQKDEK